MTYLQGINALLEGLQNMLGLKRLFTRTNRREHNGSPFLLYDVTSRTKYQEAHLIFCRRYPS
jgi:hypothetical protein